MIKSLPLKIAACALAISNVSVRTLAELDVHLYPGLTITGTVGTVYSVEYVTDLAQTNTPSAWSCPEYLAAMGNNSSGLTGDTNRPVEAVSWVDSTNYCAQLTQRCVWETNANSTWISVSMTMANS